jgi:putative effector of murein hydrolase LrgA (UPF0299 family)
MTTPNPETPTSSPAPTAPAFDWRMAVLALVIIIIVRELSVWLMGLLGYENLGNLVGLFLLLGMALCYRASHGQIPPRLVAANARILRESLFAFLPICAGMGALIIGLGADAGKILLIMVISTLFPLRLYAYLSKRWLGDGQ